MNAKFIDERALDRQGRLDRSSFETSRRPFSPSHHDPAAFVDRPSRASPRRNVPALSTCPRTPSRASPRAPSALPPRGCVLRPRRDARSPRARQDARAAPRPNPPIRPRFSIAADPVPTTTRRRDPQPPDPQPSDPDIPPPLFSAVPQTTPRRGRRAASVATRAGGKPGENGEPYVATNVFVVPDGDAAVVKRLKDEMASRQTAMKAAPGFVSCDFHPGPGVNEHTFKQQWSTKQAYEDYMNTPERRRSHLAAGVYQYLPKDKWSVPENFTPLLPKK